eukprot:gene1121-10635_t
MGNEELSTYDLLEEHMNNKVESSFFSEINFEENIINDQENVFSMEYIKPYKKIPFGDIIYIFLCIITFGFYYIFSRWFPFLYVVVTHLKSTFKLCDLVFIKSNQNDEIKYCKVKMIEIESPEPQRIRFFKYRKLNFIYSEESNEFKRISVKKKCDEIINSNYPTERKIKNFQKFFGKNSIEIKVKSIISLLLDEIITPFYVFQLYSIILWYCENYYIFATALGITSLISISVSLYQTRSNLTKLREMSKNEVEVVRITNEKRELIPSSELVPGDIIEVHDHLLMPCDAILISGQCIVNESMLTGESIPIVKTVLESKDEHFSEKMKINTLFSGTEIINSNKSKTIAYVYRTGFFTAKGNLLLSIIYPKESSFSLYADSLKFIGFMSLFAIIGMIYSSLILYLEHATIWDRIIKVLDVVTVCVPPSLPLALTIGLTYSSWRLSKKKIFCISPQKINISGMIDHCCFDKTGTLTEDLLNLLGVLALKDQKSDEIEFKDTIISKDDIEKDVSTLLLTSLMCCHGLSNLNNEIIGDPLEIEIFNSINGNIENDNCITNNDLGISISILKRFEFLSELQRMSVLIEFQKKKYLILKGSPEMFKKVSNLKSLPNDYDKQLESLTKHGHRVLSIGYKEIKNEEEIDSEITRENIEMNLNFLGFIILQNKIKPSTKETIKTLNNVEISSIMVTGDNPLTAISIGIECQILKKNIPIYLGKIENDNISWKNIDDNEDQLDVGTLLPLNQMTDFQLAVTGDIFHLLTKDHSFERPNPLFYILLQKCKIFSRMSPNQKMKLILEYQGIGKYVLMCGDGANDTSSLKAAHVGISLSQAEASIAAPFTSLKPTINSVLKVIEEGRCSLSTSFQMFEYIVLYSFLQSITIFLLYSINVDLSDFQFLYVDLILSTPIVFTMARTEPNEKLGKQKPDINLFSLSVITSVLGHALIAFLFSLFIFIDSRNQIWLVPPEPNSDYTATKSIYGTILFILNQFQTLNIAVALSVGNPFRKSLFTNYIFTISLYILYLFGIYITLCPEFYTRWIFEFVEMTSLIYRFKLLGICFFHLFICLLYELVFVKMIMKRIQSFLNSKLKRKSLYEKITKYYKFS